MIASGFVLALRNRRRNLDDFEYGEVVLHAKTVVTRSAAARFAMDAVPKVSPTVLGHNAFYVRQLPPPFLFGEGYYHADRYRFVGEI